MKNGIFLLIVWIMASLTMHAQTTPTTHTVAKGETLFQISQKYDIAISDLKKMNPNIVGDNITIGQQIILNPIAAGPTVAVNFKKDSIEEKVRDIIKEDEEKADAAIRPTAAANAKKVADAPAANEGQLLNMKDDAMIIAPKPMSIDTQPVIASQQQNEASTIDTANLILLNKLKPIKHIVGKKETLFSIAKMYNISLNELRNWNDFSGDNISPDDEVIVAWITPTDEAALNLSFTNAGAGEERPTKPNIPLYDDWLALAKDTTGAYRLKTETGAATWFDDSDMSSGKNNMYALHKSAPRNSIIQVTNPINGRKVYVKVVGTFLSTAANKNIYIRLTESAAKKLNILDDKLIVEMRYYLER